MLCEIMQTTWAQTRYCGALPPRPTQTGLRSGLGLTQLLLELASCSQAHARHLLSPGWEEEVHRASTCQRPAPVVWVRPQCLEGSEGTEGGPGSL